MARYELVEGTSSKFWEAELDGKKLLLRWGRIGTGGQSKTKTFASPALATKEHDSLVAEKVRKGYAKAGAAKSAKTGKTAKTAKAAEKATAVAKPVAPPKKGKAVKATQTAKTGTTSKEPTDAAGWLVYADELLGGGEPRAELIVMEARLAEGQDTALRKKRDALFKKHALATKGALARGIVAAGGGTIGDGSVTGRIQDVLLEKYSLAHLATFARASGSSALDPAGLAKKLGVALPGPYVTFYQWARTIAKRFPAVGSIVIPDDGAYAIEPLDRVRSSTEMWRRIQSEQPNREWRPGFVHVASWGSAYEMVMDTKADVTKPAHQLFYWDFKGGSDYSRRYKTFDAYLEEVFKLLRSGSYFEEAGEGGGDDDDDDDADLYEVWSETVHASGGFSFPFDDE